MAFGPPRGGGRGGPPRGGGGFRGAPRGGAGGGFRGGRGLYTLISIKKPMLACELCRLGCIDQICHSLSWPVVSVLRERCC